MKNLRLAFLFLAVLLLSRSADAQMRFVDGTGSMTEGVKAEALDKLTSKFAKHWKKVNGDVSRDLRKKIVAEMKGVYAQRCAPVLLGSDSTLTLVPTKMPIGLMIMTYDGAPLGCVYVNEADGIETYPLAYQDTKSGSKAETLNRLIDVIQKERAMVVAGIDQPGKLLIDNADGYKTVDIETGEVAAFDLKTQLPEYVYTGTQQHKPLAVIFSVIGIGISAAVLVVVVLL